MNFNFILKQMNRELAFKSEIIPEKYLGIISAFYEDYLIALKEAGVEVDAYINLFKTFLKLIEEQIKKPFKFSNFHKRVTSPFDYFAFGKNFLRPLIDFDSSYVKGMQNLRKINSYLDAQENVILFANHQTETDPMAIFLLLEKEFLSLTEKLIFVAGERVITDPLAVPFSLGCNLLCIYSKKHINNVPALKREKQLHNLKTMEVMSKLLGEGGRIIVVFPSGGRDRQNEFGEVEVAPFDPQSIEMFYLMARKSKKATHFYPLALSTYDILPPPTTVEVEMGERRNAKRAAVRLAFGEEIIFLSENVKDKSEKREAKAKFIYSLVKEDYQQIRVDTPSI